MNKKPSTFAKILLSAAILASGSEILPINSPLKLNSINSNALSFGSFEYIIKDDDTCEITAYTGGAYNNINIPSEIDEKIVTSIGESAFYAKSIESVTIPNTITHIGDNAFYGNEFSYFKTLTIPESVISIGNNAFYGCNKLNTITLAGGGYLSI